MDRSSKIESVITTTKKHFLSVVIATYPMVSTMHVGKKKCESLRQIVSHSEVFFSPVCVAVHKDCVR